MGKSVRRRRYENQGDMELPIGNLSEHLDDLTVIGERAPFSRALYLDINDAFGGTKPLWRMSDALRVITALCDGGAAVAQGQIFVLSGSGLHPSPPSMSDGPEVKLFTPDAWWCRRKEDESWMDYVDRAARTAQANIRRARESAQDNADIEVYADLAWSTRDELALFRLPKYLRENLRSKLTRCQRGCGFQVTLRLGPIMANPPTHSMAFLVQRDISSYPAGQRTSIAWPISDRLKC
jgi:hypothetical protein